MVVVGSFTSSPCSPRFPTGDIRVRSRSSDKLNSGCLFVVRIIIELNCCSPPATSLISVCTLARARRTKIKKCCLMQNKHENNHKNDASPDAIACQPRESDKKLQTMESWKLVNEKFLFRVTMGLAALALKARNIRMLPVAPEKRFVREIRCRFLSNK